MPRLNGSKINLEQQGFLFGLVCLLTWIYYYATNKIIFYDTKTEKYYKYNIPHPRRIITQHNSKINLGDNIGIISIKDFKKLVFFLIVVKFQKSIFRIHIKLDAYHLK